MPAGPLFGERARRLRQLAPGHSLADYLGFAVALAEGQQAGLAAMNGVPGPAPELLGRCREYRMRPLAPPGWARHPRWRVVLHDLTAGLGALAPAASQGVLERLRQAQPEWLEDQADRLLSGNPGGLDLACAPLIGAALQVYWTHLAAALEPAQVALPEQPALCPVCGSPPVAAVIGSGPVDGGLRYLHCSLCNSQWHRVRAQCSHCSSDQDIGYYSIEGQGDGAVRAEACPACRTYLKVCHPSQDPLVDPVADDLASLALDLLLGEEGFARSGVNFLLLPGASAEG